MLRDFYSKLYRIYLTVSKLYKANHFKPLSQVKLLGEFAKIWFGKNFPVAVYNETTHFQNNLYNRGKKKKKKKTFCIPLSDRPIEKDPGPRYFFIETNGFFLLPNLDFAVRGVFCTILLFLMYFYCKILNCYYFEAF